MTHKQKRTKTIYLDIMVGERFYCQLPMEHNPLFPLYDYEVRKYVEEKRPLLKYENYQIHFSNERVVR